MKYFGLLLCFFCLPAMAGDLSAPQQEVEKYFEYFNNKDREALNSASDHPFIFSIGGTITKWDQYGDAVDFAGLERSGWSYSRIHKNHLIYEDDMTAMVDVNFSRYNATDESISTTDVVYMLVKVDGVWKLKSGFVTGDLTLGQ